MVENRFPERPGSKLTRRLVSKLCTLLRRGSFPSTAAGSVGVTPKTLYAWLKRGRVAWEAKQGGAPVTKAERPYYVLYVRVRQAESRGEQLDLLRVQKAIKNGDHKMLQWKMSRRWKNWRDRAEKKVKVTGKVGHQHSHQFVPLERIPEELRQQIFEHLQAEEERKARGLTPAVPLALPAPKVTDVEVLGG